MNATSHSFPDAAASALDDTQLRHNMRAATHTIRDKGARAVAELPEWEQLRVTAARIRDEVLHDLDRYLVQLEQSVTAAGGHVHWARDGAEACAIGRAPLGSSRLTRALPGPIAGWTSARELPPIPKQTFRDWWTATEERNT